MIKNKKEMIEQATNNHSTDLQPIKPVTLFILSALATLVASSVILFLLGTSSQAMALDEATRSTHTMDGSSSNDELALANYLEYGFSSQKDFETYLSIDSIKVSPTPCVLNSGEIDEALASPMEYSQLVPSGAGSSSDPLDIGNWITIGKKVWEIISANKPVANVTTNRITILPKDQPHWQDMERWKGPMAKSFEVVAKNGFGQTVIRQVYTIIFNYGGQYNGKGSFIANATIVPSVTEVSWGGFRLDADVQLGDVVNTGLASDPVPAIDLQVHWKMGSVVKHIEGREIYVVNGLGLIENFN